MKNKNLSERRKEIRKHNKDIFRIKPKNSKIVLNQYAKEMRKNPTEAEKIIRDFLKNKKITFINQCVLRGYIVDFLLTEKNVIIEVDGGYHEKEKQLMYDIQREYFLEKLGYKVIRFDNEHILENTEELLSSIESIKKFKPKKYSYSTGTKFRSKIKNEKRKIGKYYIVPLVEFETKRSREVTKAINNFYYEILDFYIKSKKENIKYKIKHNNHNNLCKEVLNKYNLKIDMDIKLFIKYMYLKFKKLKKGHKLNSIRNESFETVIETKNFSFINETELFIHSIGKIKKYFQNINIKNIHIIIDKNKNWSLKLFYKY